jgi:FtsP/CotA-like multicopper oxidase with cupredoxin domain
MRARIASIIAAILIITGSAYVAPVLAAKPTATPTTHPAKTPKVGTRATPLTPAQLMAGMVTPAERQAAAARAAANGVKPAAQHIKTGAKANAAAVKAMAAAQGGTPDYFGAYPNYANSQLPTGPAVAFTGGGGSGAAAVATPGAGGAITSLAITSGGTGYSSAPTVAITGPAGATGATATATVTLDAVGGVTVGTPGAGYHAPVVSFGGPGAGAAATASGGVDGVVLTTPGAGYTQPVVNFNNGSPVGGAVAQATGVVDNIILGASGGTGYSAGTTTVTLSGGGATTQATVTAVIDGTGAITGFTIGDPGSGYTSAPSVAIADTGSGSGASATATISITAVMVMVQGAGYTVAPSVGISDNAGTPTTAAVATATVSVDIVVVTDPGAGYLSAPVVTIGDSGTPTTVALASSSVSGVVTGLALNTAGTGYVSGGIRKFVDTLPGLGSAAANDLGQYIPVAVADTTSFPGSDYFEIAVVQYREQLHKDLKPTLLRGYVQLSTTVVPGAHVQLFNENLDGTKTAIMRNGQPVYGVDKPSYLGPVIVAQKNHSTRIKFSNLLPTGVGGDLFIPVDTTDMGSGQGPLAADGVTPCDPMMMPAVPCASYTQNRATLHLHGGFTPWISDGTPDQWTTPASETTPYPKGVSVTDVPDMWFDANGNQVPAGTAGATNNPGDGSLTFYYTNQQSARLMFYHDHAYGITRLNVYAGEAAGYVLQDPVLDSAVTCTLPASGLGVCTPNTAGSLASKGIIPATQIPLVIQDKTFVPNAPQLAAEDPTWDSAKYGSAGNLWFPHVYMTNQNPADDSGANAMGRWDYGPWFWPAYTGLANGPVANPLAAAGTPEGPFNPGVPDTSLVPESFLDTPLVNGTVYPVLNVQPQSYRLSILNAGNDRNLNLSLFQSAASFAGSTATSMWNTNGTLADPAFGEVPMVPAVAGNASTAGYVNPDVTDGRAGGIPDARAAGPAMIQFASEGGILPAPVVLANTPVGYNYNRRDIVVLNVSQHTLFMGPAERADVVVDFSKFAGKTLILYNDAPAPVPAFDPRYDYYTGDPDQTSTGGAPTTLPGYGPNTRTIMQIVVAPTTPAPAFNLTAMKAAWTGTNGAYAQSQAAPIVPEAAYNGNFGTNSTNTYSRITDTSLWLGGPITGFKVLTGGTGYVSAPTVNIVGTGTGATAHAVLTAGVVTDVVVDNGGNGFTRSPVITLTGGGGSGATAVALGWMVMKPKAIQELFETQYGRMNATLGFELPFTTVTTQTTIPMGYAEPTSEDILSTGDPSVQIGTLGDGTQIWKITHNGVDTHTIHFHLFNVQVVNRVGWDGAIRPPDANELGWKESVRMNPLEDAIVALRPTIPVLPFKIGDSYRPIDVTRPVGAMISTFDVTTGNAINVPNAVTDFGWEYVWHCHLLGHEENDMMRAIKYDVSPAAPSGLASTIISNYPVATQSVKLDWTNNAVGALAFPAETNFLVRRANDAAFTTNVVTFAPIVGATTTFTDTTVANGTTYYYEVRAENSVAYSLWSDPMSVRTQDGLNVVAPTLTVHYGDPIPALPPQYVATNPPPTTPVTPATCTTTYTPTSPVGVYPTTCSGILLPDANFIFIAYIPGTITVLPAPLTITASSGTMAYGGAVPTITPSYLGFVNGETAAVLTTAPTCSTTATSTSPVGTYPSTCTGAVAANYAISYVAGTVTVTGAPLTITASSTSVAYGAAVPAITPAYAGFVNGDTAAVLTTAPTCTTTYTQGAPVSGSPYTTSCSGAAAANYTISYVNGSVAVTPVALTITASSATISYGAAVPAITPSYSGFVNGDTAASLTTPPTCSTTAVLGSPVSGSPYPTTCSGAVDANYTITYVPGAITITPVALTITASSATVPYGAAVPPITPTYAGFINGDTSASLTTAPTCSTAAVAGSPVGSYPTTCSGAVDSNYTITYVAGSITITPAPLTITASSGTMTYGGAVPAITPSYSGFVNGDTAASLTTAPTCSTTATSTSPVATYPSTCSGAVDTNYAITYVAGTVTINPATLIIIPPSLSKVFGAAVPAITPTYVVLVAGNTTLATPPTCTTTATATSAVGTYPTTCSGAADPNYTIIYWPLPTSLTVTPAALNITASSGTMTYGGAVPAVTPIYTGLTAGNVAPATPPTCTTTATATSAVGTYPTTCSGAVDPNYTITYTAGSIVISKATTTTTVTSNHNPSVHGQSVTFTATVAPPAGSAGLVPTGTVQFRINGTLRATVALNGAGVATYTPALNLLTTAAHPVVATYSGDVRYLASTSPTLTQTVTAAATTTTLTLVTPVSRTTTIRYTARVAVVAPGTGTPTGTVRFYRGATLIGSATLTGGVATLNYRNTRQATGVFAMHAVYVASTNFTTSTSPNVSQRITL